MKWTEKEAGVLILSHVLSVGFFPVGDTKSQPFAAIIEAKRMFPKAFQDVAMLLRQLLPNPLPLRLCPHMGQMQEQENVWSNLG